MTTMSAIEWTDATWNPVTGCSKVSPGCAHCYAEMVALRFWPSQYPHVQMDGRSLATIPVSVAEDWQANGLTRPRAFTDVMCHADRLDQPLRRRKATRYFVNSMSDLFHEDVPDGFLDRVFAVMALAPQHTFQVLTKRAERMRDYLLGLTSRLGELWDLTNQPTWITLPAGRSFPRYPENWPLLNVWLGVSVENQHFANERIPLLLQTPAAVRFISAEPLLRLIELHESMFRCCDSDKCDESVFGLDWVIVGGESGPGARPFEVSWARSIVAQCKTSGVPVFVKQIGADPRDAAAQRDDMGARDVWPAGWMPTIDGRRVWRPDLTDRKGGDMAEWPADLRVREFPA